MKMSSAQAFGSFDSSSLPSGTTRYQLATSGHMVKAFIVTAGAAAVAVRIYDSKDQQNLSSKRNILIAANAGESTPVCPSEAFSFRQGILLDFEQGGPDQGGGEVSYLYD